MAEMRTKEQELTDRALRLLGLRSDKDPEEIRRAYRRRCLLHHPDRNPGHDDQEARLIIALLTQARDYLTRNPYKEFRTDLLENDPMVSRLIGAVTPIATTEDTADELRKHHYRHYGDGLDPPLSERDVEEAKYKWDGATYEMTKRRYEEQERARSTRQQAPEKEKK